jgi:N-acetylneuraminate synthase
VLQCTTSYPCPPEKIGLNMLGFFRQRYDCKVGLSDHSGTVYPGIAGAALGLDALEVHVTLSREAFGPDVTSSVTTQELQQLVEGIRFVQTMVANPVDKDAVATEMTPLRQLFTKSVVVTRDLPAGTVLAVEHLTVKKPGSGIPAPDLPSLVGRRLARAVERDRLLQLADLVE